MIDAAIARARTYLEHAVPLDGELPVLVSARAELVPATRDSTTFGAAQGLGGLFAASPALAGRVADFLARCMEPDGTWRFWSRKVFRPVDADADATACAAAALRSVGRREHVGATQAALRACRDAEGRFLTWVRAPGAPNDLDAVVNANVLWFLGADPAGERAAAWLVDVVPRGAAPAPYYPSPGALDHALARALAAGARRLGALGPWLIERGRARFEAAGDPLDLALALATLGFLGERAEAGVARLVALQRADGSWPAAVLWTGPEAPAPPSIYWGSAELTTALAVEALALQGSSS